MGFLDALKKLVPKSEPMPWDAQSIRHPLFTLRLPEGWRFMQADWGRAAAVGPGGQALDLHYSAQTENTPETQQEIEGAQPKMLELMRMLVKHDAPRTAEHPARTAQLCLRTSVPVTSGALGAERLEALRGMLRSAEWN